MKKLLFLVLPVLTFTACTAQPGPEKKSDVQSIDTYKASRSFPAPIAEATFAGGCFWCTEAAFEQIEGVVDVVSGYSGGERTFPTYQQVSYGMTEHAEAIQIFYNPDVITYETLLDIFFTAHDPTQLNRQGPDVGKQYRSAIFYHSKEQKDQLKSLVDQLRSEGLSTDEIQARVDKQKALFDAEQTTTVEVTDEIQEPVIEGKTNGAVGTDAAVAPVTTPSRASMIVDAQPESTE